MHIFDAHSDIWMRSIEERRQGNGDYFMETHFPKLEKGKISGSIFVVYTKTDEEIDCVRYFWREIGGVMEEIRYLKEKKAPICFVKNKKDIEKAKKEGHFFALMGIEGLRGIEGNVEQIYTLYELGFRHASLTWNEENHLAAGAAIEDNSKGVTPTGEKLIKLMDKLGMILDVSHLNEKSFWDVMEIWKKPIIASHSNSKSLLYHRRNITDEQAKAIARSGGVIGVNACGEFLHKDKPSINSFLDHMEHFINIAGLEAVGIGFDFCDFLSSSSLGADEDINDNVTGLRNITYGSAVLEGLKSRGYSEEDIEKIAHGNFLRVINEIIE
ncbi:MAG: membrane dipeptidase [Clostridiales bacterium]|nr:membrane dipeptidase [Clostridiales bacterium]